VSLVHPLYYDWPDDSAAYAFPDEYLFGRDMLVRPVTAPMPPDTLLARERLWLPPGEWYEWFTGARLRGPATVTRSFALNEVPVYLRAGAIVPMATTARRSDAQPKDLLALAVFPGVSGATRVYQDAGDDTGYQNGRFAWTPVTERREAGGKVRVTIGPTSGDFDGLPQERSYVIRLVGAWPPQRLLWNGSEVPYRGAGSAAAVTGAQTGEAAGAGAGLALATAAGGPDAEAVPEAPGWSYDGNALSVVIHLPASDIRTPGTLEAELPTDRSDSLLDGVPSTLARLGTAMRLLEGLWPADWPPDALVALQQTGRRITLHPDSAGVLLERLRAQLPGEIERLRALHGDSTVIRRALNHLGR
jgi:alpha-glucosidase